jgi:hypothetical protein
MNTSTNAGYPFNARTLGLFTLACLLAAAPATAQVNYAVSGSTAYVTRSPNASGDIVIASTYNGHPVTSIASGAFETPLPLSASSSWKDPICRCT